ncbi:hypothetical protein V1478_010754 [Vespula squamosa]|uniref:Uncharacterized protein n=1 Tax=Vespula squamosa TaxID=30214 RepID=A0ABD2AF97_VESSQ
METSGVVPLYNHKGTEVSVPSSIVLWLSARSLLMSTSPRNKLLTYYNLVRIIWYNSCSTRFKRESLCWLKYN